MKNWMAMTLLGWFLATAMSAQDLNDPRTTIESDYLEMQGTDAHNFFYFSGNVRVQGEDLDIRCDELTVRAKREAESGETLGEIGAVEEIVAQGDVVIVQAGREARAGRVEVDPNAGTIRFLENPVIIQGDARASAYGFVFFTDDKRLEAMNPPGFQAGQAQGRSTISLSGLPVITPEVPIESVTVDDRIGQSPNTAEADNSESTAAEDAPSKEPEPDAPAPAEGETDEAGDADTDEEAPAE